MSSGFDGNGFGSGGSGFSFGSNGGKKPKKTKKPKKPKQVKGFGGTKVFSKFFTYFVTFLFVVVVAFSSGFFGGWLNDYLKMRKLGLGASDVGGGYADAANVKVNVVDNSDVEALVAKALPSIVGVIVPGGKVTNKSIKGLIDDSPFNPFNLFHFFSSNKVSANDASNLSLDKLASSSGDVSLGDASLGSGFIIKDANSDKKYVVTNNHVIEDFVDGETLDSNNNNGNKYIYIVFKNDDLGMKKAKVVGYDARLDVAVLEMVDFDTSKLPYLKFAEPSSIKVGGLAIALGLPLTVDKISVTRGIVSCVRKVCIDSGIEVPVVQTDAAINSGNSGGPLLDSRGEVLGVVAFRGNLSPDGKRVDGMNYAIHGPEAYKKICEIIKKGTRNKGTGQLSLGISVYEDSSLLSKYFGVVVNAVSKGSPADKAGIKSGDVISSIDGVEVSNVLEWRNELGKKKSGDRIDLVIIRRGRSYKAEIIAGSVSKDKDRPKSND